MGKGPLHFSAGRFLLLIKTYNLNLSTNSMKIWIWAATKVWVLTRIQRLGMSREQETDM